MRSLLAFASVHERCYNSLSSHPTAHHMILIKCDYSLLFYLKQPVYAPLTLPITLVLLLELLLRICCPAVPV